MTLTRPAVRPSAREEGRVLFRPHRILMATRPVMSAVRPRCPACADEPERVAFTPLAFLASNEPSPLMEGTTIEYRCGCGATSHGIALYVASIVDPCGIGHCNPHLLVQIPDELQTFHARATSGEEWGITRRHYRTGRMPHGEDPFLPHGPFVIDEHLFGPLSRRGTSAGASCLLERLAPAACSFLQAFKDSR